MLVLNGSDVSNVAGHQQNFEDDDEVVFAATAHFEQGYEIDKDEDRAEYCDRNRVHGC